MGTLALCSLLSQGASVDLSTSPSWQHGYRPPALRQWLEAETSNLTHEEIEQLRPDLHDLYFASDPEPRLSKSMTGGSEPRRGDRCSTRRTRIVRSTCCAIHAMSRYPGRAFSNRSIDWAIGVSCQCRGTRECQQEASERHIPQQLGHWSNHVTSWIDESDLMPLVVRYEDMCADLPAALERMADYLGWPATPQSITGAVAATQFDRLADQERRHGFAEMPDSAQQFFVTGRAGGWRKSPLCGPGSADRTRSPDGHETLRLSLIAVLAEGRVSASSVRMPFLSIARREDPLDRDAIEQRR